MIYIAFKGRLGNQMFQYAFARYLQNNNINNQLAFDFTNVEFMSEDGSNGWENSLKYFNIVDNMIVRKIPFSLSIPQRILLKIFWKFIPDKDSMRERYLYEKIMAPIMEQFGLYYFSQGFYNFRKIKGTKNAIICGNFESKNYFDSIRNDLLNEFTPLKKPLENNYELIKKIESTCSVCVSIRRGDYVDNSDIKKKFYVCNYKYFQTAMEYIKSILPNPTFFIFSDDMNWAKSEFYDYDGSIFFETDNNPIWEKVRLMSMCKHFIISNSTFSWWCQYLSKNESKIVVAPSRWYNTNRQSDLLESDFVKIYTVNNNQN